MKSVKIVLGTHILVLAMVVAGALMPSTTLAQAWKRITDPPAAPSNMLLLPMAK